MRTHILLPCLLYIEPIVRRLASILLNLLPPILIIVLPVILIIVLPAILILVGPLFLLKLVMSILRL